MIGRQLVPPSLQLADGDEVLDAGIGTANWILDVAKSVPSGVKFTGTDISTAFFPEKSTLPANVELLQASIYEPPASYAGRFTLVNQRLLVGSLLAVKWPEVVRSHLHSLKPGG